MGNSWPSGRQKQGLLKAQQIRQELYSRIDSFTNKYQPDFAQISKDKKKIIKQASAAELTTLLDLGKVTSEQVMLTFIERTALIGVRNNYVIDELFEEALTNAKDCDNIRKQHPHKKCWRQGDDPSNTFPPFFGVPVSLKESLLYKDRISYVGHVYPINQIPTEQTELIIMLKRMGLIPFVRTTVPQSNKTIETNNNITGYAKNPWNETRSCGGSSGGEGGIVGAYCSPIGIGSDIAGSSRIPSEFTGSITLKPYYRYSNIGNAYTGKYAAGLFLRAETTPIAHTVQDVIIWNQFMCNNANYEGIPKRLKDPFLKLAPFRNEVLKEKKTFTIGYYTDIVGHTKCSPTNRRAVYEAIRLLEKQGHSVKQIEIPNIQKIFMVLMRVWFSSRKLQLLNEGRQGQKAIPQFKNAYLLSKIPYFLKVIIALIIRKYEYRLSELLLGCKEMTPKQYYHLMYDKTCWQKEAYEYLKSRQVDIVISPTLFMPAYKLGHSLKYTYSLAHSPFWSVMNYPAGVVPVTTVREDQLWFGDYYHDTSARTTNASMKEALGLPVGVQVISYPGHEEQVLYIMQQIEEQVRFRQQHQCKTMIEDP